MSVKDGLAIISIILNSASIILMIVNCCVIGNFLYGKKPKINKNKKEKNKMIKKKLRDITKEEYYNWLTNDKNCQKCDGCIFSKVECQLNIDKCWINHKNIYSDSFLNQTIEVEGEILTNKEKDFLFSLVELFGEFGEVIALKKTRLILNEKEYLAIKLRNKINGEIEDISLPDFEQRTMFKKMEIHKEYTLEELGLK